LGFVQGLDSMSTAERLCRQLTLALGLAASGTLGTREQPPAAANAPKGAGAAAKGGAAGAAAGGAKASMFGVSKAATTDSKASLAAAASKAVMVATQAAQAAAQGDDIPAHVKDACKPKGPVVKEAVHLTPRVSKLAAAMATKENFTALLLLMQHPSQVDQPTYLPTCLPAYLPTCQPHPFILLPRILLFQFGVTYPFVCLQVDMSITAADVFAVILYACVQTTPDRPELMRAGLALTEKQRLARKKRANKKMSSKQMLELEKEEEAERAAVRTGGEGHFLRLLFEPPPVGIAALPAIKLLLYAQQLHVQRAAFDTLCQALRRADGRVLLLELDSRCREAYGATEKRENDARVQRVRDLRRRASTDLSVMQAAVAELKLATQRAKVMSGTVQYTAGCLRRCLLLLLPTCLPAYLPTCLPAYLPTCPPALLTHSPGFTPPPPEPLSRCAGFPPARSSGRSRRS
jgi:hypothetical protein